jgi:hypothetical protein
MVELYLHSTCLHGIVLNCFKHKENFTFFFNSDQFLKIQQPSGLHNTEVCFMWDKNLIFKQYLEEIMLQKVNQVCELMGWPRDLCFPMETRSSYGSNELHKFCLVPLLTCLLPVYQLACSQLQGHTHTHHSICSVPLKEISECQEKPASPLYRHLQYF